MAASANVQSTVSNGSNAKRKRIRKRNKRTTAADTADKSDSSSDSSSESEDEEKNSSSNKTISPKKKIQVDENASSDSSSSSSSESSDSSEDEDQSEKQNLEDKKRHRKRVRKSKKSETNETSTQKKKINVEDFKSLQDPSLDKRLSESTISALAYSKQFALQKDQWKFNKAKQEHLIRHMLSRNPVVDDDDVESKETPVQNETNTENNEEEEQNVSRPSWWPDEWNECVAFYLSTVQGGAKDRLIQRLEQAKQQSIPPPIEVVQTTEQVPTTTTKEDAPSTETKKSVNFAEMAQTVDSQPSLEDQKERQNERERIQFEIKRSKDLLNFIKSSN